MDKNELINLTIMTDLYELTMMQGYYKYGKANQKVVFDLFYRVNPFGGAFAIAAGLEQAVEYIKDLRFSESDIEYLRSLGIFEADFLEYLKDFRFTGDIDAIPEGTVVFPMEPLMRISASIMEAQLIEPALLTMINHQTLIATKAARVVHSAKGDAVMEFGLRRAQGPQAGTLGARAAVIGGCIGTSNVLTAKMFGAAPKGTHSHSWVMSFDSQIEAFRAYAKLFPDMCILLVDTYDTLRSGVPDAIQVFKEMREAGIHSKLYGIRLDSGDLAYLSIEARKMLDEAGFTDAIISASSDLDEFVIRDLKNQGAQISLWGVGTRLITADGNPSLGGVYKLAAEEDENGNMIPKIKLSNNLEKITNPGVKQILRIYDKETGYLRGDLITLDDEEFDENHELTIFHPINTWKHMTFAGGSYKLRKLLVPVFRGGKCVYTCPTLAEIREICAKEQETLYPETRRTMNPQEVPVDLSVKLWTLKNEMLHQYGK
jgi:nicotinate phosphoribosyltransferase